MKNKTVYWIIGLIIFLLISIAIYSSFTLRMIGLWFMIALGFTGAVCIIYSFAGAFTKNKIYKYIITTLISAICIFTYIETHKPPKVVRMKEDVLYIQPKSEIEKDIYDGSENDPNLKQNKRDTI